MRKCDEEQGWTKQDTNIDQPICRVRVESLYSTQGQVHQHSRQDETGFQGGDENSQHRYAKKYPEEQNCESYDKSRGSCQYIQIYHVKYKIPRNKK